jgi:HK97 family phage major capsid protein
MSHSDEMVNRLRKDIDERAAFIEGTTANAQDAERDLTNSELELITEARKRIEVSEEQLEILDSARGTQQRARQRANDLDNALSTMRHQVDKGEVEYRSAGAYLLDSYNAHLGDRDSRERLEVFHRIAAHQKTSDNAGLVPDPIIGNVLNFIDAARPIVSALGVRPMPSASWHRPKVTVHTTVGLQGDAGVAADEKAELDSQKMTITRLDATAKTYGGYVNVSRQNIDFSSPNALDVIVDDLAAQYAIATEAATANLLDTSVTSAPFDPSDGAGVAAGLWAAAAAAFTAVKGQGRLILAIAPDMLATFGPLFAPVNPQNAQSSGFSAGSFGSGALGAISGIQVVMSSGLCSGKAFVLSTAAVEAYEQRVGTLSVIEPSVLGTQIAYAGYFTPLAVELTGVIELVEESSS